MINNGETVTNNAVLDNDVINTNNAMDNAATNFSPHQDLPPRNRQHRPAPDRQVQQSQSLAVVVQRNPIQNPQRTQNPQTNSPHCQVDPPIIDSTQNSQEKALPQRSGYNSLNRADFPPLPTRFSPVTQQNVKIEYLPFKLDSSGCKRIS